MAQQHPSGPGSPYYRGFAITLRHNTVDRTQPDGDTSIGQKIHHSQQTDFHVHGGIRTRNPKMQAAEEPRLWPRGHRDWLSVTSVHLFIVQHGISVSALSHMLLKHCCSTSMFLNKSTNNTELFPTQGTSCFPKPVPTLPISKSTL